MHELIHFSQQPHFTDRAEGALPEVAEPVSERGFNPGSLALEPMLCTSMLRFLSPSALEMQGECFSDKMGQVFHKYILASWIDDTPSMINFILNDVGSGEINAT